MSRRFVSRTRNAQHAPSAALADGIALHRSGRFDEAEACYRRIKRRDPDYAEALRMRALLAHQRGDGEAAVKLLRRAVDQQPANPIYHHSLAGLLRARADLAGAIAAYRRAWALQPERVQNGLDLADVLATAGHSEAALAVYDELREAAPSLLAPYLQSAGLLFERGAPDAAATCLHQAEAALDPDIDTRCDLAAAWAGIGAYERAAAGYEAVLAQAPANARAEAGLGSAYQSLGQFEASTRHFERALDLDDRLGWVYAALMTNRRYVLSDTRRAAMQRAMADPKLDDIARSHMHFALGQYFDAQQLPEQAFGHFEAGNRLHARRYPFDRRVFDRRIERIVACCTQDFFDARENMGDASERPLLIVGMPRSGTSLVEQIIASHPQAYGAGELSDIARLARELPAVTGSDRRYPECLERLSPADAATLAARYLGGLEARSPDATRVTDKMPFNMLWLGLVALILPNARVIYCRREAMDNALSCYFQLFSRGLRFAYDLGDVGHVYRQHERLMTHWQTHLPLPMLTVDYEALVADPERESRRLIEFTGLDWDARCLDFHHHARDVRTASVWQVRQPVYQSSLARWKAYEPWLGPLRESLADGA
ncbi:sulfotransferase [Salinisphaera sp. T5B8]|uniref:tetratricopeptide repeat-containing sulfotransferase family protein n=1 Tax=Salinisphaera sp. T5B8 TaxID=1304154 RepID=UPI00334253AC